MTLTLDLCWGQRSSERNTIRAVETSGPDGCALGRQIEDRPPRRWRLVLPAEPHQRLQGYLRAFWRDVKGPVVPFYFLPPDAVAPVLVRFVGPLAISYDGPGRGAVDPEVEEAHGLAA